MKIICCSSLVNKNTKNYCNPDDIFRIIFISKIEIFLPDLIFFSHLDYRCKIFMIHIMVFYRKNLINFAYTS